MSNGISDTQNPQATIAHLRAFLAPLLDEPLRPMAGGGQFCIICDADEFTHADVRHKPTCAVLVRDHILGR